MVNRTLPVSTVTPSAALRHLDRGGRRGGGLAAFSANVFFSFGAQVRLEVQQHPAQEPLLVDHQRQRLNGDLALPVEQRERLVLRNCPSGSGMPPETGSAVRATPSGSSTVIGMANSAGAATSTPAARAGPPQHRRPARPILFSWCDSFLLPLDHFILIPVSACAGRAWSCGHRAVTVFTCV